MEIKSQKNGISQLNLSLSLFGILCVVHLTKWVVFFRNSGIKESKFGPTDPENGLMWLKQK